MNVNTSICNYSYRALSYQGLNAKDTSALNIASGLDPDRIRNIFADSIRSSLFLKEASETSLTTEKLCCINTEKTTSTKKRKKTLPESELLKTLENNYKKIEKQNFNVPPFHKWLEPFSTFSCDHSFFTTFNMYCLVKVNELKSNCSKKNLQILDEVEYTFSEQLSLNIDVNNFKENFNYIIQSYITGYELIERLLNESDFSDLNSITVKNQLIINTQFILSLCLEESVFKITTFDQLNHISSNDLFGMIQIDSNTFSFEQSQTELISFINIYIDSFSYFKIKLLNRKKAIPPFLLERFEKLESVKRVLSDPSITFKKLYSSLVTMQALSINLTDDYNELAKVYKLSDRFNDDKRFFVEKKSLKPEQLVISKLRFFDMFEMNYSIAMNALIGKQNLIINRNHYNKFLYNIIDNTTMALQFLKDFDISDSESHKTLKNLKNGCNEFIKRNHNDPIYPKEQFQATQIATRSRIIANTFYRLNLKLKDEKNKIYENSPHKNFSTSEEKNLMQLRHKRVVLKSFFKKFIKNLPFFHQAIETKDKNALIEPLVSQQTSIAIDTTKPISKILEIKQEIIVSDNKSISSTHHNDNSKLISVPSIQVSNQKKEITTKINDKLQALSPKATISKKSKLKGNIISPLLPQELVEWKSTMKRRDLLSIFIANGWILNKSKGKGSHIQVLKNDVAIHIPHGSTIKPGTLNSIRNAIVKAYEQK